MSCDTWEAESKAGSTTVLRRGRENFQQKIICDRFPACRQAGP